MRVQTQVKPGFFSKADRKYIALSEVPRTLNLTASEVTDAVALGELEIELISGCKAVALDELFRYIESKAG